MFYKPRNLVSKSQLILLDYHEQAGLLLDELTQNFDVHELTLEQRNLMRITYMRLKSVIKVREQLCKKRHIPATSFEPET